MDSYLMMLYVSVEQEKAMRQLFTDNGWNYCKPDLLQLTDKLGGLIANNIPENFVTDNTDSLTSLPNSDQIRITSPSRPATRSQKSKIIVSSVQNASNKRKTRSFEKKNDNENLLEPSAIKVETRDVVNDEDLNEYMEHGDEDDDYIDDEDKEVKKKARRITKTSESEHIGEEMDDFTAKLDGTEDMDPEESMIIFDEDENSSDDEGNESNTDSFELHSGEHLEPTDKVKENTTVPDKSRKRSKRKRSYAPVQFQCGSCKVKYMDKKELNKHLTDKVCMVAEKESILNSTKSAIDVVAENEQVFDNLVLGETEKVAQLPVVIENAGNYNENLVDESISEFNDEVEDAEKSQKNFYKCDQCDLSYKTTYNLKTHQVMKHRMVFDELFECDICYLVYGSKHILELHKKDKHPSSDNPADRVQCEDCNGLCDDFKAYVKHKKREHNIIVCTQVNRPHVCATCGKGFTRSDSLKTHCDFIHLRTKQRKPKPKPTERKYVCDFCGKAFLRRNNLSEHISVKHKNTAKKHECKYCGETFLRPHALEYHTNKIHMNKKPYECDKCHKTYFSPVNLRQHQELCYKEEEEKEACPHCDKRFVHKRNLQMHIEAIHSQSPLTCECGFVIKWRSSIAKHRRRCRLLKPDGIDHKLKNATNTGPKIHVQNESTESVRLDAIQADVSEGLSNTADSTDAGFTTISTDTGMQVISNEIAQALRDQGLLVDGTVAGTLKMEDGKTVVEEDPSVQSVYYVIMKE